MNKRLNVGTHWKFHLVRARPSQRIFARLGVLSSRSFIGASHAHSDSFRAIITWLEVCPYVERPLWLHVLMVSSQGQPAPPFNVYLRYQKILLTEEERERREADKAIKVSLSEAEAQELPPPTAMLDTQSSIKGIYRIMLLCSLAGCWILDHYNGASFSSTFKVQPRTIPLIREYSFF